jgi:SET domain-containing protein
MIINYTDFINENSKTIDNYLYLGKSTIPNAGKGLFTKKSIKKGETISEFLGRLITDEQCDIINDESVETGAADYFITLSSGEILDTYGFDCFAMFANDAEGYQKTKEFSNNSEIEESEDGRTITLVATKDISEGSEIFADYGKEYWDAYKTRDL